MPGRNKIHTKEFDRTLKKVEKSLKKYHKSGNPYAITEKALGYQRSIKPSHRRR